MGQIGRIKKLESIRTKGERSTSYDSSFTQDGAMKQ
jgi:hypothetical protein